jgi:hypothetical protein
MIEDTAPWGFHVRPDALGPAPLPHARPAALLCLHLVLLGSITPDRPTGPRHEADHPGVTGAARVLEHDVRTGRFRLGPEQYARLRQATAPQPSGIRPTPSGTRDMPGPPSVAVGSPVAVDADTVGAWAGEPWHQALLYLVHCLLADFVDRDDEYLAWLMANGHLAAHDVAPLPPLPVADPAFDQALTQALLTRDATELLQQLRALSPVRPSPLGAAA